MIKTLKIKDDNNMQIDPELEAIKARVKEMEEEAEKIKQMQSEVDKQMAGSTTGIAAIPLSIEEKQEIDGRSVYVGNVDYGASAEELEAHFHGCGTINRVTILCNKADGHPKGFAYIEFGSKDYVETALAMNETLFRGRQIKVGPILFLHIFFLSLSNFSFVRSFISVELLSISILLEKIIYVRVSIYFHFIKFRLCLSEQIVRDFRLQIDFLEVLEHLGEE